MEIKSFIKKYLFNFFYIFRRKIKINVSKEIGAIYKRKLGEIPPLEQVSMAYQILLQRPIDDEAIKYWSERIVKNDFDISNLIDSILSSPEYLMIKKTPFHEMVHLSRVEWVKKLPMANSIFDIGGSSPNIKEGALIELGYPYRPKELTIFDLPPDEQYWGKPKFSQDKDYKFTWGKLNYFHGRIENIKSFSKLKNQKYDMIYMGQTIEHIYPEKLPDVLEWIRKSLKNDGYFIFDTPNRDITKLQISDKYIDADHKIEYIPYKLKLILEKHGFLVTNQWGLLPMPNSFKNKKFNPLEIYNQPFVNFDAEKAYLFAFLCKVVT